MCTSSSISESPDDAEVRRLLALMSPLFGRVEHRVWRAGDRELVGTPGELIPHFSCGVGTVGLRFDDLAVLNGD